MKLEEYRISCAWALASSAFSCASRVAISATSAARVASLAGDMVEDGVRAAANTPQIDTRIQGSIGQRRRLRLGI